MNCHISILKRLYDIYYFSSTFRYYSVTFGDGSGTYLTIITGSQSTTTDETHVETGNIWVSYEGEHCVYIGPM